MKKQRIGKGVLLHISSLPGKRGIGSMGKEAREFADFLAASGNRFWQVLPLGHTSYGDSPYQTFSVHAGNPYFIDVDMLYECGILKKIPEKPSRGNADYGRLYSERYATLREMDRSKVRGAEFTKFCKANKAWLDKYSEFMAVKDMHGGSPWYMWEHELKYRTPEGMAKARKKLKDEIEFYKLLQFLFFSQWRDLKQYCNSAGIEIIGDMPIYVAHDSADVWADGYLFDLDSEGKPASVAGVPPDAFSSSGQLWGNPLYNWQHMAGDGYKWWLARIDSALKMFDYVRIDHFRAFADYYAIPFGSPDAKRGEWRKGPGMDLFSLISSKSKAGRIIAEDLGELSLEVYKLMDECGFPGMRVAQFAFGGGDGNPHLVSNHIYNCVAYTGTHDNQTARGWLQSLDKQQKKRVKKIAGDLTAKALIEYVMSSPAKIVIIPMQDYLNLDDSARMNIPSKADGNWQWRLHKGIDTAKS